MESNFIGRRLGLRFAGKSRRIFQNFVDASQARLNGNRLELYWWDGRKNFGDLVTKELLVASSISPVYSSPELAQLVGAGSILQKLPQSYAGEVIGSGLVRGEEKEMPNARFHSVRGALTREKLGLRPETPLGDLGLIADRLISSEGPHHKRYHVGIVPHYVDKGHPWVKHTLKTFNGRALEINVERSAAAVASDIIGCEVIVSSSLHGLIFADALGVPSVWCEMSDQVFGGGFKFKDYGSSIDFDMKPVKPEEIGNLSKIEGFIQKKSYSAIQLTKKSVERVWSRFLAAQKNNI